MSRTSRSRRTKRASDPPPPEPRDGEAPAEAQAPAAGDEANGRGVAADGSNGQAAEAHPAEGEGTNGASAQGDAAEEVADEAEADADAADADAVDDGAAQDGAQVDGQGRPGLGKAQPASVGEAHLKSVLESLVFASDKPATPQHLAKVAKSKPAEVRRLLEELAEDYKGRGLQLLEVAGGWQFRTAAVNAPFVRELVAQRPVRLSRAQLETLAIVAYRQPVTRPEVEEIRGVDSGSALKVLADRGLVKILGRKEEPGRPLLYGTTPAFLEFFGLSSLKDLPTLQEFSELNDESRALFERQMGEPIAEDEMDLARAGQEAAEHAAAAAAADPDDDDEDDAEEGEAAATSEQGDEAAADGEASDGLEPASDAQPDDAEAEAAAEDDTPAEADLATDEDDEDDDDDADDDDLDDDDEWDEDDDLDDDAEWDEDDDEE